MNHEELKILLSAYLDGEVTPEEKDIVENHLVSCASCQEDLREFKKVSSILKRWPQSNLSPDIQLNIKARSAKKERTMEKQAIGIQWAPVVGVLVVMVLCVSMFQQYAKRGLQARVRDASLYLTDQTIALGKTTQYEPYYLSSNYTVDRKSKEEIVLAKSGRRLKSATDDIGDQFSPGNTNYLKLSKVQEKKGIEHEFYGGSNDPADKESRQALASVRGRDTGGFQMSYYGATGFDGQLGRVPESAAFAAAYATNGAVPETDEMIYNRSYTYPTPQPNTESYSGITENNFLSPFDAPLSTFSIDVDTASYSNVRRFLNQGQLPPADAVRVEELINYFSYDYPEPAWGQPFSVSTELAPCPWNPSHQLALIGLQGKRLNAATMPASNLVFLIDVSGSMNTPNKLPLLQDSFRMLAQELESKDKVSIVVYAGAAGMVLEATPGNYKERIISAVDRLQAGGSTAGGAGIQLAYQIARANFIPNGNNRVILATDGDFNVGISDDNQLVQMIQNYRDQGIFLTVLGFGMGNYKDSKMEKLADQGNGNYFYIDNINEGRKVLVHELGSTLFAIAKDVKIQVEFNPATVESYRLIGYENRKLAKEDFNDDTKDAGELGAGHTVTALYEIVPAAGYPETRGGVDPLIYQKTPKAPRNIFANFASSDVMTVKLRYKEPKGAVSKLIKKTVGKNAVSVYPKSENIRFASAVAEFGLLLRNSPYRGIASFEHVLSEASSVKTDPFGYRLEFLNLVERARSLNPYPMPIPVPMRGEPVPMDYYDNPSVPHEKSQK